MIDLMLRTETREKMDLAISAWIDVCSVDEIGVISKPTGEIITDEDGVEIDVLAPIAGWHVNIRTCSKAAADDLSRFAVVAHNPVRVWL